MFDKEVIELGKVQKGVENKIVVKYIGDEPFDLAQMRTSCGCTGASYNSKTKEVSFSFTPRVAGQFSVTGVYKDQYYVIIKAEVE